MKKFAITALALLVSAPLWAAGFTPLDRAAARGLTDVASHKQPTIVALWSSDCSHCKKNLRLFATMAKAEKRLRLVSVATEPESPEIKRLLDGIPLPGERYAYGSEAPEALAYALDPTWRGELPRTFLFDGKGGKQVVSGALSEVDLRKALTLDARAR